MNAALDPARSCRTVQMWADFCDKDQKAVKETVVPIRAA
jgi:hypothetical protein